MGLRQQKQRELLYKVLGRLEKLKYSNNSILLTINYPERLKEILNILDNNPKIEEKEYISFLQK